MIRASAFPHREQAWRWLISLILTLVAVVDLYPIFFMAANTLKTNAEYLTNPLGMPRHWTYLDNYIGMFYRFDLPRLFFNTLLYILLAAALSLAISIPGAFALAKMNFPARGFLRMAIISTLIIPTITFIIPNYLLMSKLGLVDHYLSVVLLWGITSVPGTIFLLSAIMRGIPNEVLEAAKVDGAGFLQTLLWLVMPLSVPGIITVLIFNCTGWWNDLLLPLIFLQSDNKMTITVAVATIVGRYSSDYPLLITGLLLASIPPMGIYILMQRYIRQGLVIGSIK
ncbi:binding-protein-dependent transport systems inner membrane component [Thermobaculum terrenum ATCC BAA-798]|uniref:Binding-protein-dependent transport systems inner membrane component n=1 Tax=Thermobaculum terrenum (strain ATCC BAA-798 / CCMEE 7001 / YNP1) TaxID=525904 RepID=D1CGJ6_THET1|nr:carbohydrate ABC transporter permease [Thermobaculum terrenum]ACZ42867.1 binding-protein-dependent transport systems inner membrane component [Thermobaculum terrenum ATCC BAA-798]